MSRKLRKIKIKTPGGKIKLVHKKSKPGLHRCSNCNNPLHGVPHTFEYKFKNLPKSSKRSSRPYSNLCSRCMRILIIEKYRQ